MRSFIGSTSPDKLHRVRPERKMALMPLISNRRFTGNIARGAHITRAKRGFVIR
jgi:hypothetical protein